MNLSATSKMKLDAILQCTGRSQCKFSSCILYNIDEHKCEYEAFLRSLHFRAQELIEPEKAVGTIITSSDIKE